MLVYRMENREHVGMYTAGAVSNLYDTQRHPSPWSDNLTKYVTPEYRFGFADRVQMYRWIGEEKETYKSFKKNKIYIGVYKLDKRHVRFGEKQIVFKRDKSVHVAFYDPKHLLNVEYITGEFNPLPLAVQSAGWYPAG